MATQIIQQDTPKSTLQNADTRSCVALSKVDEKKNGDIDSRLRIPGKPQGTNNIPNDRMPRGRPPKETKDTTPALPPAPETTEPLTDIHPKPSTEMQTVIPAFKSPTDIQPMREQDIPNAKTIDDLPPEPPQQLPIKKKRSHCADPNNKKRARSESKSGSETGGETAPRTPSDACEDDRKEQPDQPSEDQSLEGPQASPRYFTRSTRKRSDSDIEGRDPKKLRAFIGKILNDDDLNLDALKGLLGEDFESAFPAETIAGVKIPRTYEEAINDKEHGKMWKAAMAVEMLALYANNTFREVILPDGANPVSCQWVFTIKTHNDGSIER